MILPTVRNYGDYDSDNYGAHSLKVDLGRFAIWYSYRTIIAFQLDGQRFVSENVWSTTTGKHLNWIDGGLKKGRLPYKEFTQKLQAALKSLNLSED